MTLDVKTYEIRPLPVQAVRVTEENHAEMVELFGGWPAFWLAHVGQWALNDDEDGPRAMSDADFHRRYQPASEAGATDG